MGVIRDAAGLVVLRVVVVVLVAGLVGMGRIEVDPPPLEVEERLRVGNADAVPAIVVASSRTALPGLHRPPQYAFTRRV
jgi:hypothetical protein